MMSRQRKMVSEYVGNQPKCGSVVDIDNDDLEPLYASVKVRHPLFYSVYEELDDRVDLEPLFV